MNLIETFLKTAAITPENRAVVSGTGETVSFEQLARRSGVLATRWKKEGIGKGDRVLVAMPVGIDLYAAIAALWRLGAVIVFPEPAMGLAGLKHAIEMTRPDAFLAAGAYRLLRFCVPSLWPIRKHPRLTSDGPSGDGLEELNPGHPALISFTSGSTGKPKGIVRSHGFLAAQNACVAELLTPKREGETDLVAFPVFVISNLGQGITSVLPNWPLTRHDQADAGIIGNLINEQSITRALVPPSICRVLAHGGSDPGLADIFTGGGPIFPDLIEALSAAAPQTELTCVYGSTEAEPISHLHAKDITAKQWTDMSEGRGLLAGAPVPQTAVKIIDDEIVVTGDHVNKGYLDGAGDDENKIRIDGQIWHRTGDAGALDDAGNLWLKGRWSAKAGEIYPFEAEVAARSWPGVEQAALLPGSDPPVLAIEGREPSVDVWQSRAKGLGGLQVRQVAEVPLDRRHRSKVDYGRLRGMLNA
ncbi:MAG: AMP-binding protein [Pseudomonadota bacterium]